MRALVFFFFFLSRTDFDSSLQMEIKIVEKPRHLLLLPRFSFAGGFVVWNNVQWAEVPGNSELEVGASPKRR